MPRIIPRLLRVISQQSELPKTDSFDIRARRSRPNSLHRPCPPIPSFRPASYSRSILLDSTIITRSRDYVRRKSLPPRIYVPKGAKARKNEYDCPRQMNEDERRWWANPYCMQAVPTGREQKLTGYSAHVGISHKTLRGHQ